MDALAKLSAATTALAQARTLDEVKQIIDIAEAARTYARAAKLGLEASNHAAEVKLRAERKAGELLQQLERSKGGDRHSSTFQPGILSEYRAVLTESEIAPTTAHRWQTVAQVPDEAFEQHLVEVKQEQSEVTSAGLLRLANEIKRTARQIERAEAAQINTVSLPSAVTIHNVDARDMLTLDIAPVHLVVTSPPYNVGIEYATHDDSMTEADYEDLLSQVFGNCEKLMVDGARIAVVVPFGVGRAPWIPVPPVIYKLLNATGFTLRGQIIWDKSSTGNRTSWGSFRLPSDPTLRDTTEAIIVAHKGDGKLEIPDDARLWDDKGAHVGALASSDYFMELAQDHWIVGPESAQRIGHPAPFPVALVRRLIDFYAFPGAHVLDPFGGSGTTAIAAMEARCTATLIEMDAKYCQLAKERLNQ